MHIEKTVIYPQTYHQSQNRQEVQIDLLVKEQGAILDINSSAMHQNLERKVYHL